MTAGDMTYIFWHKGTTCIKSTEGTQIINTDGTPLRKIWSTSHTMCNANVNLSTIQPTTCWNSGIVEQNRWNLHVQFLDGLIWTFSEWPQRKNTVTICSHNITSTWYDHRDEANGQ